MSISLHEAIVPGFIQTLGALDNLLDKAAAWCAETGNAAEDVCSKRIAPDMFDFAYQVNSCSLHSIGAIRGAINGKFVPPAKDDMPRDFGAMQATIRESIAALKALEPADLDGLAGKDVVFEVRGNHIGTFEGQSFLLTFSQPNFYFHATTAYDILRGLGMGIGKLDYLGELNLRK